MNLLYAKPHCRKGGSSNGRTHERLCDGLSGLVHVSQISHKRIKHPGVVLQEGQEVDVKVLAVKDRKISLSIKALLEEPEETASAGEDYTLPETGEIGTSLADLPDGLKLD